MKKAIFVKPHLHGVALQIRNQVFDEAQRLLIERQRL